MLSWSHPIGATIILVMTQQASVYGWMKSEKKSFLTFQAYVLASTEYPIAHMSIMMHGVVVTCRKCKQVKIRKRGGTRPLIDWSFISFYFYFWECKNYLTKTTTHLLLDWRRHHLLVLRDRSVSLDLSLLTATAKYLQSKSIKSTPCTHPRTVLTSAQFTVSSRIIVILHFDRFHRDKKNTKKICQDHHVIFTTARILIEFDPSSWMQTIIHRWW